MATSYYYLGGKLVALKEGSAYSLVGQDHLGSTTTILTDTGGSSGSARYHAYGLTMSSEGGIPTEKKFTGQRLGGSDLYYYNARYYDPTIGRFISADTIVPNAANPQALNRYSYVLNNPLKYTDSTGHRIDWDAFDNPGRDQALYAKFLDWVANNLEAAREVVFNQAVMYDLSWLDRGAGTIQMTTTIQGGQFVNLLVSPMQAQGPQGGSGAIGAENKGGFNVFGAATISYQSDGVHVRVRSWTDLPSLPQQGNLRYGRSVQLKTENGATIDIGQAPPAGVYIAKYSYTEGQVLLPTGGDLPSALAVYVTAVPRDRGKAMGTVPEGLRIDMHTGDSSPLITIASEWWW